VAVVLVNGRPLAIPELAGQASAILEAWLPGEQGAWPWRRPSSEMPIRGKLPISFPRHVGRCPSSTIRKPFPVASRTGT